VIENHDAVLYMDIVYPVLHYLFDMIRWYHPPIVLYHETPHTIHDWIRTTILQNQNNILPNTNDDNDQKINHPNPQQQPPPHV
jgi:hypothetical protein